MYTNNLSRIPFIVSYKYFTLHVIGNLFLSHEMLSFSSEVKSYRSKFAVKSFTTVLLVVKRLNTNHSEKRFDIRI